MKFFLNNIKFKFRSPDQFVPQVLANHIEIKIRHVALKVTLNLCTLGHMTNLFFVCPYY